MDTRKIKNFIVLVLLIVNAILLAVVLTDAVRERGLSSGAVEGVADILAANGIDVSPEADLSERSLAVVEMRRDTGLERQLAENLIGECSVSDLGGNILHYVGQNGQANFRGTGSFEMQVYDGPNEGDPLDTARRCARELGLDTAREPLDYDIDERLSGTVELACSYGGSRILNCRVSFTFGSGELMMIIGTRSPDTAVSESDVKLLDVPTVLLRFLAIVTESGRVCSSLDTLELCYSMTATAAGEAQLVPVWRIGTDAGDFFINAVTGAEEGLV